MSSSCTTILSVALASPGCEAEVNVLFRFRRVSMMTVRLNERTSFANVSVNAIDRWKGREMKPLCSQEINA